MGWCILVFIGENLSWRLWVWEEAKALWHMSLYTFAGRAASGLMAGSEGFLLGVLISPETAGIYSLTTRAHDIVRSLAGHFSTALMPSLAHLLGEGNRGRFNEVVMTVLKIQMNIAAAGMAGVVVFNESFVSLWVGSGFFAGNWINLLFSIWAIGYMMGGVGWQILYAAGEISYLCKLAWLEASLRIALSFIFIPILGIVGAPLSAIIAQHAGPIYLIAKRILRLLDALRSGLIELTWAMVKRLLIAVFISFLFYQASGLEENWLYFTKYVALYLSCTLAFTLLVDREIFAYLRSARKQ
jgi:O-antigen/teichoic acid export membrane protein